MRQLASVCVVLLIGMISLLSSRVRSEDPEPVRTILILPEECSLIFADSVTVPEEREAIRDYVDAHRVRPGRALTTDEEQGFWRGHPSDLADDEDFRGLLEDFDVAIAHHRGERGRAFKVYHRDSIERVVEILEQNDIEVEGTDALSGMVFVDGNVYDVETIRSLFPGTTIDFMENMQNLGIYVNAETRAGWLHDRGVTGSGFDYLLVDTGLDSTVTDIVSGHDLYANTDTNFYTPFNIIEHGTITCSIAASANATAQGTAYGMDGIFVSSNAKPTGIPSSDLMQHVKSVSWGMADTEELFGDTPEALHTAFANPSSYYSGFAKFLDSVVDEFDVFVANAAGNYQFWNDRLAVFDIGHCYNPVVVNAIDSEDDSLRSNDTLPEDPTPLSYGAWGPAADGRKKPDMCVPVQHMYYQTIGSQVEQSTSPFTSFAAPQVAGAALLLMDGYGVTNQRTLKALMINTAFKPEAAEAAGWEQGFGWGMLDADHAAFHADQGDYFESSVTTNGTWNDKRYYYGTFLPYDSNENSYDRATVVWERHASFSYGDTNIVVQALTDIDLFMYDPSDMSLVTSSTSAIDNVEQVFWDSETDTLKALVVVDCESTLPGGYSVEPFSLATEEGFTYKADAVGLTVETKSCPNPQTIYLTYPVKFRVFLDGVAECDTILPTLTTGAYTQVVGGPSPSYLTLAQGDTGVVQYSIVNTRLGGQSVTFKATSSCYRRTWWDDVIASYTVLPDMSGKAPSEVTAPAAFAITRVEHMADRARIHYVMPQAIPVELAVFDVRGRQVYAATEAVSPREGALEWLFRDRSGAPVASGVYFLQLTAGQQVVREKVLVVH